jgi:hypothetical protein
MLHCSRNCSLSSGREWSRTMPKTPRTARKLARAEVFLQRVYYLPACGRPTSRSHIDRRVWPSQGQDAGSSPVEWSHHPLSCCPFCFRSLRDSATRQIVGDIAACGGPCDFPEGFPQLTG